MPKKIIIIRHAETDHNRNRIWQGWTDIPLNKEGLKQAKRVAARLQTEIIDTLYTSDLKRARQTAKEIARNIKVKIHSTKKLRERNLGILEGLHVEESQKNLNRILKDTFNFQNENYRGHKGETINEAKIRIRSFLNYLRKKYQDKTVALVTHGGTKYGLLRELIKDIPQDVTFENTSITVLEKNRKNEYRITIFSDTKHLRNK